MLESSEVTFARSVTSISFPLMSDLLIDIRPRLNVLLSSACTFLTESFCLLVISIKNFKGSLFSMVTPKDVFYTPLGAIASGSVVMVFSENKSYHLAYYNECNSGAIEMFWSCMLPQARPTLSMYEIQNDTKNWSLSAEDPVVSSRCFLFLGSFKMREG